MESFSSFMLDAAEKLSGRLKDQVSSFLSWMNWNLSFCFFLSIFFKIFFLSRFLNFVQLKTAPCTLMKRFWWKKSVETVGEMWGWWESADLIKLHSLMRCCDANGEHSSQSLEKLCTPKRKNPIKKGRKKKENAKKRCTRFRAFSVFLHFRYRCAAFPCPSKHPFRRTPHNDDDFFFTKNPRRKKKLKMYFFHFYPCWKEARKGKG